MFGQWLRDSTVGVPSKTSSRTPYSLVFRRALMFSKYSYALSHTFDPQSVRLGSLREDVVLQVISDKPDEGECHNACADHNPNFKHGAHPTHSGVITNKKSSQQSASERNGALQIPGAELRHTNRLAGLTNSRQYLHSSIFNLMSLDMMSHHDIHHRPATRSPALFPLGLCCEVVS